MNIVLYLLLSLYFGTGIFLLTFVRDEKDRIYFLHHPFGGLMIFLFGPIVAAVYLSVPAFRRSVRSASAAKKNQEKPPHCCEAQGFGEPGDICPGCEHAASSR